MTGSKEPVTRIKGGVRNPNKLAPSRRTPGGADWAAEQLFGSAERCMEVIGAVAEGGQEERWLKAVVIWREWKRRWAKGELAEEPSLNQLCSTLKIPVEDFLAVLQKSILEVWGKLSALKASLAAPEIVEAAIKAAGDTETGFKDRQMLLEMVGLIGGKPGVQISLNQQVGLSVSAGERERRLTPLLQFTETIEELDEGIRGRISQRALGQGDIIEGEIIEERTEGVFEKAD